MGTPGSHRALIKGAVWLVVVVVRRFDRL
jgi:hypothetical protein